MAAGSGWLSSFGGLLRSGSRLDVVPGREAALLEKGRERGLACGRRREARRKVFGLFNPQDVSRAAFFELGGKPSELRLPFDLKNRFGHAFYGVRRYIRPTRRRVPVLCDSRDGRVRALRDQRAERPAFRFLQVAA